MMYAPSEPVFVDHSLQRQLIQQHNAQRQDLLQDMAGMTEYGYSYEAPWYNPFAEREFIWRGDRLYNKDMDLELKSGTRQYAIDAYEDSKAHARSSRHAPTHPILQPIKRDER